MLTRLPGILIGIARPFGSRFPARSYHLAVSGDREGIFSDDTDREQLLQVFAECVARFGWVCPASCLMDNRYYFLVETPLLNLAGGMRRLNGS
ncbi:MAG: hypothetical protein ACHBNF_05950 [Chromatiales bacterium]